MVSDKSFAPLETETKEPKRFHHQRRTKGTKLVSEITAKLQTHRPKAHTAQKSLAADP